MDIALTSFGKKINEGIFFRWQNQGNFLVRNKKNCEKQFDTFFQHNLTYLNQKILIFKTDPNCAQFLLSNKEYVDCREEKRWAYWIPISA